MRIAKQGDEEDPEHAIRAFHVGTRMQLRAQRNAESIETFSSLVGFVQGEFLIVKSPMVRNTPFVFNDGEEVLVRVFTGTTIYSFGSTVMRTFLSPLYYMHIGYPQAISRSELRSEPRIRLNTPVTLEYKDMSGNKTSSEAALVNLSLSGAGIECRSRMAVGEQVQLSFSIQLDRKEQAVRAKAVVRNAIFKEADRERKEEVFACGLQFEELDAIDHTAIRLLTYETLLFNRRNVV